MPSAGLSAQMQQPTRSAGSRHEDAAFFRRLFKRVTGITPGAYRRRFQVSPCAR